MLMLKNELLRASLHHLALSNLSQDFLLNPKPLRIYFSGFRLMIDSICISSLNSLVFLTRSFDFLIIIPVLQPGLF